MKLADPHYTPVSSDLLDRLHILSEPEVRVILAVCRKALGDHDDLEWFVNWETIRELTNLSQYQATVGVATLENHQWLIKANADGRDCWQLNLDAITGEEEA